MAVTPLDVGGLAWRSAAASLFVFATVPFALMGGVFVPDDLGSAAIPLIIAIILISCLHLYYLYRAYYALKLSGLLVFTLVYCLLAYYFANLLGLTPVGSGFRWYLTGYLCLLYTYGICYNSIDSYISGLLHTKNV